MKATLETDFTGGDRGAPARLTEQLLGKAATGLAVLAPHGGKIEVGTDDQARMVFDALAQTGKPVRAWIARGAERASIANRVAVAGNGIQLEQPAAVRIATEQRDAIARAVAAFYLDLI